MSSPVKKLKLDLKLWMIGVFQVNGNIGEYKKK